MLDRFNHIIEKYQKNTPTLQVQVTSEACGIHYTYSSTGIKQKYHSASIGKVSAAVMVLKAHESQLISIDHQICKYTAPGFLDHLFVYKNQDYQHEVTFRHLLSHTSGVNDYFEGKLDQGRHFLDTLFEKKDFFYHPKDLIDLTRTYQKAVGKPGMKFKYSDTGYLILGLLLEQIYQAPLHEIYQKYLFGPLNMSDTTLIGYSPDYNAHDMAPLIFKGQDIHTFSVLSFDFSGGGLSTTTEDLTVFLKALFQGHIISKETLIEMQTFSHTFHIGLYYGLGMIEVRFNKLFFMLKGYPNLQGGLGVSAAHAWCDPETYDTYVINMGDMKLMGKSFRLLIELVKAVKDEREKRNSD